jgi:pimeloyl-ACP methyl ester carboxylesterase
LALIWSQGVNGTQSGARRCRISSREWTGYAAGARHKGDDRAAIAIVPGLAETAADWRQLIEQLAPIPAAAVTLRGRGNSSCPPSGYSLADHASDIDAFVRYLPARSVVLVAFSRSVAYALEYATARPSKLAGLVLLDYPPRHSALPAEWVPWFAQSVWRGRRADEVLDTVTIGAIRAEAALKDFTVDLPSIAVPALVIRGGQAGAALSESDADTYMRALPNCEVVKFESSSHALWDPDPSALPREITRFMERI